MLTKIFNAINLRAQELNYPYQAFGIFGLITYPGYYLLWRYSHPEGYENLTLRLIVCALCIPLVFSKQWPKSIQKFLPCYWYLTILYCLPFLFTFFLFKNDISNGAIFNFLAIITLMILILDLASFLITLFLGILLGWLAFYLTTPNLVYPDINYFDLFAYTFSLVFFAAIFAHRREKLHEEKLESLITLSSIIAHELRTPLRTIESSTDGLSNLLPKLTQTYDIAKQQNLDIPFIAPQQFQAIGQLSGNIKSETYAAFMFIDMLLQKTKSSSEGKQEKHSIRSTIDNALHRYPFSKEERERFHIGVTGEDFTYFGNDHLILHIFFNLTKNALYYIYKAQKGGISISLERGDEYNTVRFKDTGTGIAPRDLPHVFERFFSRTHHGTGLGLAFSKMVMESLGGKISCASVLGEYTEFTLYFPVIYTQRE